MSWKVGVVELHVIETHWYMTGVDSDKWIRPYQVYSHLIAGCANHHACLNGQAHIARQLQLEACSLNVGLLVSFV
jgi:hypothetical protein